MIMFITIITSITIIIITIQLSTPEAGRNISFSCLRVRLFVRGAYSSISVLLYGDYCIVIHVSFVLSYVVSFLCNHVL